MVTTGIIICFRTSKKPLSVPRVLMPLEGNIFIFMVKIKINTFAKKKLGTEVPIKENATIP